MNKFLRLHDNLPPWLQFIVNVLLVTVVARVLLLPLLTIVPAYLLFGGIFALGFGLLWWRALPDKRRITAVLLLMAVWGSATLALYSLTLMLRDDDSYIAWAIVAGALFLGVILVLWRTDKKVNNPSEHA